MAKKSHIERLHSPHLFTKFEVTKKGRGVIASPLEYDELMRVIPKGKVITVEELRSALAKKHKADYTSSQAIGYYINMVANASVEHMILGSKNATPYWRTLKKNGELNETYPGGLEGQKIKLAQEGHSFIVMGKKYFVCQYQDKLYEL